jgi:hypothetical protein
MSRIQRLARPAAAIAAACVFAACSTTPPLRYNDDGQLVQRVCDEEQSASGSRLNPRVCRDVVVEDSGEDEATRD